MNAPATRPNSSSYWDFNLDAIGAGANFGMDMFGALNNQNSFMGALGAMSSMGNVPQMFPTYFSNQQNNPYIAGFNTFAQNVPLYTDIAGGMYGAYNNLMNNNYMGAINSGMNLYQSMESLGYAPNLSPFIHNNTGMRPIEYEGRNGETVSGYAPYMGAFTGAYNLGQGFSSGNVKQAIGGAINLGHSGYNIYNTYNQPNQSGSGRGASSTDIINKDGTVTDATTGQTIGSWVQGATGALQIYDGVQQFRDGDRVGGSINMAVGGTNVASAAGNTVAGSAVPYMNAVAGGYNTIKAANNSNVDPDTRAENAAITAGMTVADMYTFGGASLGRKVLSNSKTGRKATEISDNVFLNATPIGAQLKAAFKLTGSKKGKDQFTRDKYREYMKEQGLVGDDWMGELADGTKFDFGKDGKGFGKVDWKDPLVQKMAAFSNVLVNGEGMSKGSGESVANMHMRAALSNAKGDYGKALQNMQHFARQRGITLDSTKEQLNTLLENKEISKEEYDVRMNDANELFKGTPNRGSTGNRSTGATPRDRLSTLPGSRNSNQPSVPNIAEGVKGIAALFGNKQEKTTVGNASNVNLGKVDVRTDKSLAGGKPVIRKDKSGKKYVVKHPNDPNTYSIDSDGKIVGTLIGWGYKG